MPLSSSSLEGGDFLTVLGLSDMPEMDFVDMGGMAGKLGDTDPAVRLEGLRDLERVRAGPRDATQWGLICFLFG
jgi:hypothetical protein